MNPTTRLASAVAAIAACVTCHADEIVRRNIAQSIPSEVIFSARLDLNAARKSEPAAHIVDAARLRFEKQLAALAQFSTLSLHDVDCIWVGVVKDKEALVVLEGRFNTEAILNAPVVTNSKRLVRPGTVMAIEMRDEKTDEPSHAVVINEDVVAFGLPQLVDRFTQNYVSGRTEWGTNGLAAMGRLASSDAQLCAALMQVPEKMVRQNPFLASVANALVEVNVRAQVAASARLAMQDEAKAAALRDLVSGFVGLGLASEIKTEYPDIAKAVLAGLKLGADGRSVILSSTMDVELLRTLLRKKGLELN